MVERNFPHRLENLPQKKLEMGFGPQAERCHVSMTLTP